MIRGWGRQLGECQAGSERLFVSSKTLQKCCFRSAIDLLFIGLDKREELS